MFFFSALTTRATTLAFVTELYEEQSWTLCQRECQRALLMQTKPTERFQLLYTLSSLEAKGPSQKAIETLSLIIEQNIDPQASAIAAYELGRLQWSKNQLQQAADSFAQAFFTTNNKNLFIHSACSLFQLFKEAPILKTTCPDLVSQINSSRDEWNGPLFAKCARPKPSKTVTQNAFIRFYRTQISPAIGNRCILEPSCSEYYHQAHTKHGWMAYPMIADRFFREPEVSNARENPYIRPNGEIRYLDPITNHDFWIKK